MTRSGLQVILGSLTSFHFFAHGKFHGSRKFCVVSGPNLRSFITLGPQKNMAFVARMWAEALGATFVLPSFSFNMTLVLRIPTAADLMRTFETIEVRVVVWAS